MNSKTIFIAIGIIVLLILAAAAVSQFSKQKDVQESQIPQVPEEQKVEQPAVQQEQIPPQQQTPPPTPAPAEQKQSFNPMKQYTATLATDKGEIVLELNKGATPKTVENFVTLAQKKFYDGTIFHRTIKGFMIQGGDPKGDGTGGPGYKFDDESFVGDYTRGTIAMANAGPNTNGSQFFIMHQDYPLPKNYVIFGQVTKGLDVVDAIATAPVMSGSMGEQSKPVAPVKVLSVTITEK